MNITVEMMDEVIKRKKVSYGEAKEALEKTQGDIAEALVLLDDKQTTSSNFLDTLKKLVIKLHRIKLVIMKDEKTMMRLPGTVVTLALIFAFPLTLIALILALLLGCRMRIENSGHDATINQNLTKVSEGIEKIKE